MSEHATEARQDAAQAGGDTLYWAGYTVFERTGERPRDADSQANRSAFDELVRTSRVGASPCAACTTSPGCAKAPI